MPLAFDSQPFPMSIAPAAPLGRPRSSGGSFGSAGDVASSLSSPTRNKPKPVKRPSDAARLDSSGSEDEGVDARSNKRRQAAVKRACNECRQQKLKCDVATEPAYQACERCRRLKLTCRIDSNFRRIGKRSEKAQMEKEIIELRAQLASISQQSSPVAMVCPIGPKHDFRLRLPIAIDPTNQARYGIGRSRGFSDGPGERCRSRHVHAEPQCSASVFSAAWISHLEPRPGPRSIPDVCCPLSIRPEAVSTEY